MDGRVAKAIRKRAYELSDVILASSKLAFSGKIAWHPQSPRGMYKVLKTIYKRTGRIV